MDLSTFFQKFDQFADAPDAVPKLRELILLLSVRGKLTEQVATESCESHLTAAHAFAKRKGRLLEAESSDSPFPIPENWGWVAVGHAMNLVNGTAFKPENWTPDGTPIVRIQNLNNPDSPFNRFNGEIASKFYIDSGDFLISWSGTPGTSFGAFIWNRGKAILNQHIFRCELVEGVFTKEYLRLAVNARLDEMISRAHGAVGLRHITKGKLESIPLPIPPIAEQKRIVAKVDELMALCDRLEAQQQERESRARGLARAALARFAASPTPANLALLFHSSFSTPPSGLRKSILTLAVQGKLVPQDPNDEPALTLLNQIAAHKAALAKAGKYRGSTSVKPMLDGEEAFELPASWTWVRFGEIMINRDGERIPVSKEERATRAKTYDYYGASGVIDQIDSYLFDKPLLLIGEDGANLINRSTPIAFIARGKYWVNNHAHVLDGISEDFLKFIELHINAINLEEYVTGTAQPKMNQAKMNSISIALPPLAEQRRIVVKVERLMALVDALEHQLAASRATAEKLLTALVAELTSAHTPKPRVLMAAEDPGRYDTAVTVPVVAISLALTRATLAAEIVHRMHGDRTFGQIKFQKALYLTEYIAQLSQIDSRPERYQNGPHDPELIAQVEAKMKECGWFEAVPRTGGHGHEYQALPKAGGHQKHFEQLWPQQVAAIRKLIDEMKSWKTERCERFATLYAAWNDLLIWSKRADDAAILDQVLNHWHTAKQQIPKSSWQEMLTWMKREGYAPTGWGRATATTPQPEFF